MVSYSYMEELYRAGRIKSDKSSEQQIRKIQAETMFLQGWAQRITWETELVCLVASQSDT